MPSTPIIENAPTVAGKFVVTEPHTTWEEKRASERNRKTLTARLIDVHGAAQLRCSADNISEGGFYVCAPESCGLAVGQRFEVMLSDEARSGEPDNMAGEGCYATVVRTERLAHDPDKMIGAGLRFDQPLLL